jgi:hypothetical protein
LTKFLHMRREQGKESAEKGGLLYDGKRNKRCSRENS